MAASPAPGIKKIRPGFLHPSAAMTLARSKAQWYAELSKPPAVGDLVYGTIGYIGQHSSLENKEGRIHQIHDGTKAVFVFGSRYAPDFYEAVVPDHVPRKVDLVARSGMVGQVMAKNALVKDPTRVTIHGYVCSREGEPLNTRALATLHPKTEKKTRQRAKLILVVGTSMNSGKSVTAAACCWALNAMGYHVRGSKVTGTASLKDILHMEDCGAHPVSDFTFLGYPSTYLLEREEVLGIFNTLDLKYANNPKNYWVVEIADGIVQRETAMLLEAEDVRSRIHRLIFAAHDAFGAIGGLRVLDERFGLRPDAISGICSSSPLGIRELQEFTEIPVFNNTQRDLNTLSPLLL